MHRFWRHVSGATRLRVAHLGPLPPSVAFVGMVSGAHLRCETTASKPQHQYKNEHDIWTTGGEAGLETLDCIYDTYGGVIVNTAAIPHDVSQFRKQLTASIAKWRADGRGGVWLDLPSEDADLIPIATKEHGFVFHSAEATHLTLKAWLPTDRPNTLPGNASHTVGVGAVVVDETATPPRVLLVRECSGPAARLGIWKLPTGLVDAGEEIHEAAVREVLEETGVKAEFIDLRAFRMAHGGNLATKNKSNLFFVCRLRAQSREVITQETEISEAKWFTFEEYDAMNSPPKGTVYELLNRSALGGEAHCVASEEVVGFRPGNHWMYTPLPFARTKL